MRALVSPHPVAGRGCGVPATYISSQQGAAEAVAVKKELRKAVPTCKVCVGMCGGDCNKAALAATDTLAARNCLLAQVHTCSPL